MLTSCKKNSGDRNKILSDFFLKQWNNQDLHTLKSCCKWTTEKPHFKVGYVVIVRYKGEARSQWPVGLVEELFPSADERVRKVHVCLIVNGKSCTYMSPFNELNMRPIRELHLSN